MGALHWLPTGYNEWSASLCEGIFRLYIVRSGDTYEVEVADSTNRVLARADGYTSRADAQQAAVDLARTMLEQVLRELR